MRRRGLVVLVVMFGGGGCLLPGLDDFAGDGTTTDASTNDAIAADGPTADAADGPVGSFCQRLSPAPTFCADFDQGDFPAGFDSLTNYGAGKALLDNGAPGDPARSFSTSTAALTGSTQAAGALVKKFPSAVKASLRIEFDYLPLALDGSERSLVALTFGKDDVHLFVRNSGARVAESGTIADGGTVYGGGNLAKGFTVGTKVHVKWVVTVGSGTSSSSVTLDTDAVEFDSLHVHNYPSPPQVGIGMVFVSAPSTGWGARIDNVVYDLK